MHLYVYYEVPLTALGDVAQRVRTMQAGLAIGAGRTRFLKRPSNASHAETWMEVYEDVDASFEAALADAVAAHGIATLTGDRHAERFLDH